MNRCLLVLAIIAPVIAAPDFAVAQPPVFSPGIARQIPRLSTPPPPPGRSPIAWRVSGTDHFDITYAPELDVQIGRIGRQAERAYQQVSSDLRHDLSLRPLLVLFGTRAELERAVTSGTVPGNREHILLPLDAPAARVDGDLVHELAHVFAFDIVPSLDRREVPRWIQEGLAEFERGDWDASELAVLRQMLRMNTLPRLSGLRAGSLPAEPRINHILGHAAVDYLVSRAGRGTLKRFLLSLRESSVANPTDVYIAALGLSVDDFDRGFDEYLRARFPVPR
jgi:hypothetical protein